MKLPGFLEEYFWDVEFEKIDLQRRKVYVLKRIMDYGDQRAVSWMWKNFERQEIKDVLHKYRGFSQKSANFWAVILNIPREEVLCLKKRSSKEPKTFWPY